MSVRSTGAVTWTCDACGRQTTADLAAVHPEGLAWPPTPSGWTRHDREADGAVLFACSDRCRWSVAPAGIAWTSLRYDANGGDE